MQGYNCSEWWRNRESVDTEHPQLLEVSVGYWHQTRPQAGEFDGERYSQKAYDLHPDHLALENTTNWPSQDLTHRCLRERAERLADMFSDTLFAGIEEIEEVLQLVEMVLSRNQVPLVILLVPCVEPVFERLVPLPGVLPLGDELEVSD